MHMDNYMYKDTYNTLDILYANTSSLVFNGFISRQKHLQMKCK